MGQLCSVPTSLEAALVFAVLIVPGLLLISGYNRTRAHSLPRRDLYVLAQAVVVSLAWVPALWLLGGRSVLDWGEAKTLRDHDGEVIGLVLVNLAIPLMVGLVAGRAIDWIGGADAVGQRDRLDRDLRAPDGLGCRMATGS